MLTECLINEPVLALPNDSDTFILDKDASNSGLGAVLSEMQGEMEKYCGYSLFA